VAEPLQQFAARDLCWNCQSEAGGEYFCDSCVKIQPVSSETDYFGCFGLPRALDIDLADLERRFYELSRKFHPDYFQKKSDTEKSISLENSAVLNTAYRTLRDPLLRAAYLIQLEEGAAKSIPTKAPSDLFEEILEIQEVLEEFKRSKASGGPGRADLRERLSAEKSGLESRMKQLDADLSARFKEWDALLERNDKTKKPAVLEGIKEILSNRSYLETVLEGIEKELSAESLNG
jgi:molecular chaperone HscB